MSGKCGKGVFAGKLGENSKNKVYTPNVYS
jgi:hypothetical protein